MKTVKEHRTPYTDHYLDVVEQTSQRKHKKPIIIDNQERRTYMQKFLFSFNIYCSGLWVSH